MNLIVGAFLGVPGVIIGIIGWLLMKREDKVMRWVGRLILAFGLFLVFTAILMALVLVPVRFESGHL